jgi:endonuclease G
LQQIGNGVLVPPQIFKAIYIPSKDAASAYVAPNSGAKEFKSVSIEDLTMLIDVDVFPKLAPRVKTTAIMLPPPQPPRFRCRLHEQ